ncbi:MAG: aminotransferase class III-fold pyridoxal phosphate-dependent enzyme [Oscillospiraceae bacterium]|jgi:taurine--2-oxoglutarate transaminase|nr:aminotransferase class III-fold pyridoxal phosphate-dependent enzyme [Oscillospiraceae bacterium]
MALDRQQVIAYDQKYNQHPWLSGGSAALPVEKGSGIYFWDYNGKRYTDMCSQLGNVNLGYGNKAMIQAAQKQLEILPYIAPARASGPRSELAKMLIDRAPQNMAKVFFACGGSDSNEAAINMARNYTGKSKILSMYRSYHGSTLGSGNLSGDPRRLSLEKPAATGFLKFFNPYTYHTKLKFANDKEKTEFFLNLLEEQIVYEGPDEIAAVEVESVVGANGILIPPQGYLQGLRALTKKYHILLICDEVMAGFYRTGKLFGFMNWDIEPDIITFAKGITCGYVPLGGIIISKEIADFYEHHTFQYGLTYSGHSLACAVGVATLHEYDRLHIEENVQKTSKVLGELLEEQKAKHKSVGDVRYIGLFGDLELVKNKGTTEPLVPYGNDSKGIMGKIKGALLERGFAAMGRENNITLAPPLIITEQQLREEFPKLDEVLSIVDEKYTD